MSDATTMAAVQRALAEGKTVRADGVTIKPPAMETQSAREEREYAAFARAFGWHDEDGAPGPSEPRMVTMSRAEFDKLKAESDSLDEMLAPMRTRPAVTTAGDEAEYRRFASAFGWR